MRRVLFVTVVLAVLFSFAGSAFAAEPQRVDANYIGQLGEVWFHYYPGYASFERVDAFMYSPSTLAGWPLADAPVVGTWWAAIGASEMRRQSWPAYQFADEFGFYFTAFMLPRDEAWYPCSFPLKWKCNFVIDPFTVEYHSPATQPFEAGLVWPWAVNPMDTVSPVEIWLVGYETGNTWVVPFEITGYFWKWSDIN